MVLIHGVLLHGRLHVSIIEASELWLPSERTPREKLARAVLCRSSLNPYVTVSLEHLPKPSKRILKTHAVPSTDQPTWNHSQQIDVATNVSYVVVHVKSAGGVEVEHGWGVRKSLGFVRVKAEHVLWGVVDGWFRLGGVHGGGEKNRGRIRMRVVYEPVGGLGLFGQRSVPGTYFGGWDGCDVRLFADACDGIGEEGEESGYFERIYYSVLRAKKLVYLCGWSVDTTLRLLRGKKGNGIQLGELLKRKAGEGVTVLLMVWDEVFSTSNALVRLKGIMDTKDEITRAFFRGSAVKAAVVPRLGGLSSKVMKAPLVPCLFTFHEKLVITDIEGKDGIGRELVGFCGGLDLTYGRWDTPRHCLFGSLENEHKDDFHNGCFDVRLPFGPRQPWHDVAAMIRGPVVKDFIICFEERWKRQGLGSQLLLDLENDNDIVQSNIVQDENERWTVQVFRSIDERSALFDKEMGKKLETKMGRSIDRSIHHAYVHYTRAAKRFIYIEQQYFIGSSNQWISNGHKDATNLIPHELALKIVDGIQTGNIKRAYIVIPLYPEGVASDGVVQKILYFQMKTVEMMMKQIAVAIKECEDFGAETLPTDFVSFFCLGKRESFCQEKKEIRRYSSSSSSAGVIEIESKLKREQSRGSNVSRRLSSFGIRSGGVRNGDEESLNVSRRQMIYVHSKMFISDDEVVLLGSANLNERSMSGVRDTEIAFSAFQDGYQWNENEKRIRNGGGVRSFRRRLWKEHLGLLNCDELSKDLDDGSSLACMQEMRRIGRMNWQHFSTKCHSNCHSKCQMKGHLMLYPYDIDRDGNVKSIVQLFPDTKGKVLGFNSNVIPNILVS